MNSYFVTKREKTLSKHFVDHFLPPYEKVTLIQVNEGTFFQRGSRLTSFRELLMRIFVMLLSIFSEINYSIHLL